MMVLGACTEEHPELTQRELLLSRWEMVPGHLALGSEGRPADLLLLPYLCCPRRTKAKDDLGTTLKGKSKDV